MQADSMRDHLIATTAHLAARVLTKLFSRSWEMGENSSEDGRSRTESSMRSEEARLRTFQRWPASAAISPAALAAAGFFFVGPGDRVECFCCGGELYDWLPEDDPVVEHKKFFPRCPFIRHKAARGGLPDREIWDCVDGQFLGMLQSLGMEEALLDSSPEYPEMETEGDRLVTFDTWPSYAQVPPELLARAGFFYTGDGDYVRCFYCDGALRNWERGDDPWMEHARWFPRCKFLLQSRGLTFVSSVQESYSNVPVSSEETSNRAEQDSSSSEDSLRNLDLASPQLTSLVQRALQMGFHRSLVLSLLQNKYQQMGASYPSLSELVLDLLQAVQDRGSQAEESREPPQREPDLSRVRREAEEPKQPSEGEPASNVEDQLRRLQEERTCKVCMDKEVSIVLVPCGHLVVCAECAPNLRRCPICRATIRDTMRAFMS
ncbi:baculoviral IAP repeat-containing protein 7 isoform X1 [Heteronotia binoei]|uniref:baculoviral IAP repeat-containing protein 7 isoform X1 n=1 Tax=Heteronotia binoei TaxID=13085 RepID=UPI00293066DC|nr:baculoviral IAP repeat-containing protein 7 isoform X1 [Heteronotia binoei]XP_060086635.1 baculoviral IAP repeat-containing protein 7 isoform X1 [Heteronotia binoei]